MGNLLSTSDKTNTNYNLTEIEKLKDKLGNLKYDEKNYDILKTNFYFRNFNKIVENLNKYNINEGDIEILLKSFDENIKINFVKGNWLKNQQNYFEKLELLKKNVELLDLEDKNNTEIVDLGKDIISQILLDKNISENYDINENKDLYLNDKEEDIDLENNENEIKNVYKCKFIFNVENAYLNHNEKHVLSNIKDIYLGFENEHFIFYKKQQNMEEYIPKGINLVIEANLYEYNERLLIIYNNIDINKDVELVYDYELFNLLNLAIDSMNNNNNRLMSSYIKKFKKKLDNIKKEKIVCKSGDIQEGELVLLEDFLNNLDI